MRIKEDQDEIPERNEAWIRMNHDRFTDWCEENYHLFGNSKCSEGREIFYSINPCYGTLALRYPPNERRGNVGQPLDFNQAPVSFKAVLEGALMNLLICKHNP